MVARGSNESASIGLDRERRRGAARETERVVDAAALEEQEPHAGERWVQGVRAYEDARVRLVRRRAVPRSASAVSHDRRSETSTAWIPPRSESSQNRPRPLEMLEPPNDQPAGNSATHGSCVADGTDWASRTNTPSSVLVHRGVRPAASRGACGERDGRHDRERDETSGAPHANAFQFETIRPTARNAINSTQSVRSDPAHAPSLDPDRRMRRRERSELRQQVHPVLLHQRSQLGGARHARAWRRTPRRSRRA